MSLSVGKRDGPRFNFPTFWVPRLASSQPNFDSRLDRSASSSSLQLPHANHQPRYYSIRPLGTLAYLGIDCTVLTTVTVSIFLCARSVVKLASSAVSLSLLSVVSTITNSQTLASTSCAADSSDSPGVPSDPRAHFQCQQHCNRCCRAASRDPRTASRASITNIASLSVHLSTRYQSFAAGGCCSRAPSDVLSWAAIRTTGVGTVNVSETLTGFLSLNSLSPRFLYPAVLSCSLSYSMTRLSARCVTLLEFVHGLEIGQQVRKKSKQ